MVNEKDDFIYVSYVNKSNVATTGWMKKSDFKEFPNNVQYFEINDPDGYSNLRKAPGGDIIRKVLEDEQFEVIGSESNHKKVRFEDGSTGFIHESRVKAAN